MTEQVLLCRVWNDQNKQGQQPTKSVSTTEALRTALRTALVVEASAILEAHKEDDARRPLHLHANLMLSLWIGACMARASPPPGQPVDAWQQACTADAGPCLCCAWTRICTWNIIGCIYPATAAWCRARNGKQSRCCRADGAGAWAGGKPSLLKEQTATIMGLFQYVSLEMMWGKPMPDWEFVRDVIRPTFGEPALRAGHSCIRHSPLSHQIPAPASHPPPGQPSRTRSSGIASALNDVWCSLLGKAADLVFREQHASSHLTLILAMCADVELPAAVKRLAIMAGLEEFWDWDPTPGPEPPEAAPAPASQDVARSAPSQVLTGADQDGESSCAGAEAGSSPRGVSQEWLSACCMDAQQHSNAWAGSGFQLEPDVPAAACMRSEPGHGESA